MYSHALLLEGAYNITIIEHTSPKDVGYGKEARFRNWKICVHRHWAKLIADPREIFKIVSERLKKFFVPQENLWLNVPSEILQKEMLHYMNSGCEAAQENLSMSDMINYMGNWLPLCGDWENQNYKNYEEIYKKKFGVSYNEDPNAVVVLTQSAEKMHNCSVYLSICIYIYTYTFFKVYFLLIYVLRHIYIYMYICIRIYIYIYSCIYIYIYLDIYIYISAQTPLRDLPFW